MKTIKTKSNVGNIKEYQVIALFNDYIELYFYKDGNIINYEEIYSKNI